ncbi:FHIPEP family type III secretion protein [Photobacterium sp. GJ3]|uniref:flagellar biosynthesis protein FlhA n=1 Tax=Photobacterium sp. GJ3 TaxID=2829502 RepID=UPI001B8B0014|nr:flagellar biosynthesis protein FlhA [Photobacterium sp. GJ3]QUJ68508.1 FHIPEP family type III secretion protein [Photobacterium sp. GJ3]
MFKQYMLKDWHSNLFIIGVVLILMVIFLPVPPEVLDFLQIINFSVALLILLLTFCTDKPLSFSTFPSIILIATLFRLSLNISATRLILSEGEAGHVIGAIGEFVVAGNYVIGFIVFIILVVVQYVVVTNGAQRVAEVAARFTLDSMPGKQMAIDADMNMGLIDEHEARERRSNIEREANFYGAMDGATKFVKGDAIAGIIIILIDIIGGVSVGVAQHGMKWGEALTKYSLLTVGDGIVTQIPSLIIAVATGIIITRAATDYELSREIGRQVSSHPRTLILVTLALILALFLDGLPTLPILLAIAIFGGCVWWAIKSNHVIEVQDTETDSKDDLVDYIKIHPIEVRLGKELKRNIESGHWALDKRLEALKKLVAKDFGYILPDIQFKADSELGEDRYEIHIHGSRIGKGQIQSNRMMVISAPEILAEMTGEATKEPAYGLPALWVDESMRSIAKSRSCTIVEPEMIIFTHISEAIKNNLQDVLSRKDVEQVLNRLKQDNASLVEEIVPQLLSISDLHRLLRLLLSEKVSIRHIELILEAASEHASAEDKNIEKLVEKVRERLALRLCERYLDAEEHLNVITMTPQLESMLKRAIGGDSQDGQIAPGEVESVLQQLVRQCESVMEKGLEPVLLCSGTLRAPLRKITERVVPRLAVISAQEVKGIQLIRTVGQLTHGESR